MSTANNPAESTFEFDLGADEMRRRAAVVEALGSLWDPAEVLRGEQEAHDLLYSNLDERQLAIYDELVRAGVLDTRDAA